MIKRVSRKAVAAGSQAEAMLAKYTGLSLVSLNFIPLLVSVLVVLASGYVAYLQFASLLSEWRQEKNATVAYELATMLSDLGQRKGFHSYPVKRVEVKKVLHEKEGELFRLTSQSNVKTPRVIKDRMIEDEEIPDLTFVGEDGMSVEEVAEGSQAQREKV